jgi:hypothetical protein
MRLTGAVAWMPSLSISLRKVEGAAGMRRLPSTVDFNDPMKTKATA